MKKNKLFWILTVVCVLNFAAHLYFYPSLPDIVPTHWGAGGQVNGWGPKSTILFLAAIPFVPLIMFEVIRKIDAFTPEEIQKLREKLFPDGARPQDGSASGDQDGGCCCGESEA